MFDGLISRWTMPRACACAIASPPRAMCGSSASRSSSVPRAADELLERPAADLAHHVERRAARRVPGVVDRHDRRVLEPRGDLRLALEPRASASGSRDSASLSATVRPSTRVGRLDDAAHAAARDLACRRVAPVLRHRRRASRAWGGGRPASPGSRHHRRRRCPARLTPAGMLHRPAPLGRRRSGRRLAVGHACVCHARVGSRSRFDRANQRPREQQADRASAIVTGSTYQ